MQRKTEDERIEDWIREIGKAPDDTMARIVGRIRSSMRNASYGDQTESPRHEKAASCATAGVENRT